MRAAEYIAGEFKKIGLLPALAGSYFQPFEISIKSIGKDNHLSISGEEFRIFEDYVPLTVCPNGEVSAKGLLLGEGSRSIDTPAPSGGGEQGEGRYSSEVDLRGKIAILRYDESARRDWVSSKIREMERRGAAALLILKKDLYSDYTIWEELVPPSYRMRWERIHGEDLPYLLRMKVAQRRNLTIPVSAKIPCLLVREERLGRKNKGIVQGEAGIGRAAGGLDTGESGNGGIANNGEEKIFSGEPLMSHGLFREDEIDIKVDIREDKIPARNLIGYLPGKGDHKDEIVIIGAHYDHLGLDSKGRPFPGADDNASGVSAMLKVAKRLAEKAPLSRSVAFIAFDGEEWGLTGSRYYVDHPVFSPIDKTILMINMDTIGRNEADSIHFLGSSRSPDVRRFAGEIAKRRGIVLLDDIEFAFEYGSDHYPFYEKGIPAVDLTSSYHEDFHRITDTPERVDVAKVSKIADLVYLLTLETADSSIYFQTPLKVDIPFPGQR